MTVFSGIAAKFELIPAATVVAYQGIDPRWVALALEHWTPPERRAEVLRQILVMEAEALTILNRR